MTDAQRGAVVNKVVSLDTRREHISGRAECTLCGHSWIAVTPVRTTDLECPKCGGARGRWRDWIVPDEPMWVCNTCSGDVYAVTPSGISCLGCGLGTTYGELAGG